MKNLILKLLVVALLALMLILAPLMYTQAPKAVLLAPVTRSAKMPTPNAQTNLSWYQQPQQDGKYLAIPSQALKDFPLTGNIYLLPSESPSNYCDTGKSYLVLPQSGLSKFMTAHQAEIGATTALMVYGNLNDKYQIVREAIPVLEINKTANSKQVLLKLSPNGYQEFMQLAKQDAELKALIVNSNANESSITLDPSANSPNIALWLKSVKQYLKNSSNAEKQLGIQ